MSKRDCKKAKESIRSYFGTRSNSGSVELKNISVQDRATREINVCNMATGEETASMVEIYKLIKGLDLKANSLDGKVTSGFANLNDSISKLTDKVDTLEFEVEAVKKVQKNEGQTIAEMRDEIDTLKQSLLATKVYSRKYHLLLYGVDGHETNSTDTIARVRMFTKDSLKMEGEFAKSMTIQNAHRLQKHVDAPATIIVVFLYWSEREAFLKAGPNLRGSKMSVRTDLPPELRKRRGELASIAYELRRNQNLQTRIREKGAEVWIETRKNSSTPWKKREV